MLKRILFIFMICLSVSISAEENDTLKVNDSTETELDSIPTAEKAYKGFLERQQLRQQEAAELTAIEIKDYISIYDSLLNYLLSDKINRKNEIKKITFRDVGDYYKHIPSTVIMDYQSTPMRKTIQPFSLAGRRMNFLSNGQLLSPFEHFLEPDGLVDVNDIPTALDDDIYLLPGGSGQIFGGEQSIATYLAVPNEPDTSYSESSFDIEKAQFGYAYTKGNYSKRFTTGKEIDFSLEYRRTDGIRQFTDDNSYQYTGRAKIPLNQSYHILFSGNTLRRKSRFVITPDFSSSFFNRNRTDRKAEITIEKHNEDRSRKYSIGYIYQKQKSNIDGSYVSSFHYHNDGIHLKRESVKGSNFVNAELFMTKYQFKNGYEEFDRYTARPVLTYLHGSEYTSFALSSGFEYMETYKFLPFASLLIKHENKNSLFMFSVGYSEKAPSLYQLHLPFNQATVYSSIVDYADQGNGFLGSEKQLTATTTYKLGNENNNIEFSITGGKIFDGIDWYDSDTVLSNISLKLFHPKNSDINFTDFSIIPQFKLFNLFKTTVGASYHYKDYKIEDELDYSPEYQMFTNVELHLNWKQKMIDFYAYGEYTYTGPYSGYNGAQLGEVPLLNFGLAFELKSFRFHYIFLNSTQQIYSAREGNDNLGRYSYYGFSWDFLD